MSLPHRSPVGVLLSLLLALGATALVSTQTDRPSRATASATFTEAGRAAGLAFTHLNGASPRKHLVEIMGSGGLFFDYDNDGWPDVFLVDGGSVEDAALASRARHRLFRNRGNGTFEDRSAASGIVHRHYGMGVCAGDYDNDGWIDLYITNDGPNTLYRNRGDGTFADVTRRAGVGAPRWSVSCAFADFDGDGDLDLFVVNYVDARVDKPPPPCGDARRNLRSYCHPLMYDPLPNVLFRNDGNGVFTDVSDQAGIGRFPGNGLGVVVADFDDDGRPDVFVANDTVPNLLFFNEGNWRFSEGALLAGVAVAPDGRPRAGMGTDAADYDGDGRLDIIVTNHEFEADSLFRNAGGRLFTYATTASGIGPPTLPVVGFGTAFLDYDNDAGLDLATVTGHVIDNIAEFRAGALHAQRNLLFRNSGGRRLLDVTAVSGSGFTHQRVSRGLASADIDNDGDLDLLITNNGGPVDLLVNSGSDGGSIMVRLVGRETNRDGIGARVRVTAGGRTQVRTVKSGSSYLSQHDLRVHVGLGGVARVDRLEVMWPQGRAESFENLQAGQVLTIRQGEGIVQRTPYTRPAP